MSASVATKYIKIGADGKPAPADATDYVAVYDPQTNLMWARGTADIGAVSQPRAIKEATKLQVAGYTDWRLPTRKELLSLVDEARFNPAIDPIFECKSDWYWSSTVDASSPCVCAWAVSFYDGSSGGNDQFNNGFVRAVRVGQ